MLRALLAAMSCAFVSISPSAAATPPPPLPFDSVTETLRTKPVTQLLMGKFVISLEVTGLPEVRRTIGIGSIGFEGDGADAASWLCYTLDDSLPHERLWIISNAEMGGPGQQVDGVRAQLANKAEATNDCPSLPKQFHPISFNHAVWLGTSAGSMRSIFGSPSKVIGQWQQYYYSGKTRGDGRCAPDGYDVLNGVAVKIERGLITDIHASQTTSC